MLMFRYHAQWFKTLGFLQTPCMRERWVKDYWMSSSARAATTATTTTRTTRIERT